MLELWRADEAFRGFFLELLSASPFPAFYFETPPITSGTLDRTFEFVLLPARALEAAEPDPFPFSDHFREADRNQDVIRFPNLGGDALLVVPCPRGTMSAYRHIGAFVREAPVAQQHELLRQMSLAVQGSLSPRPLWLSTAGGGVDWLHVRLDSFPKYYVHAPYRRM